MTTDSEELNLETNDQAARRAYWTQQMDAAFQFMETMRDYPVAECGEPLVSLKQAVAEAKLEVEFSDSKIAFDLDRVYFLREGLIAGFLQAAREMNQRGWIMKVEDGFRSLAMQQGVSRRPLVFDSILKTTIWELGGEIPSPDFMLKRLTALTATRPKIGTHMSGSAIDISVLGREDGQEIDRGGLYLEMSELTPMLSPFISRCARENREEITQVMERNGLIAYPFEFWHYNGGDCYVEYLSQSGKPARYGAIHFDESTGLSTPVENPDEPLQTFEVMEQEIKASLARLS